MRKINIAQRLRAIDSLIGEVQASATILHSWGVIWGWDPVAYWFPSTLDSLGADLESLADAARRLPGAAHPDHGRALAALRVRLTETEEYARQVLDDYLLMERRAAVLVPLYQGAHIDMS